MAVRYTPAAMKRSGLNTFLQEFQKFIARGNVVDLAVAVVMGTAFGAITNSLVKDILMPPIGLLVGGMDFSNLAIILKGEYASLEEAVAAGAPILRYGVFINTIINFLIVSLAMFVVVKTGTIIQDLRQAEEDDPASPVEPPRDIVLLQEIRDLLARQQGE